MERDHKFKSIRPIVESQPIETSIEEQFQNNVLRPILKLQNDLIIGLFDNYVKTKKSNFFNMDDADQIGFIKKVFQNDSVYRNQIIGIIIGQFTLEELNTYLQNEPKLRQRIIQLMVKRIADMSNSYKNTTYLTQQ